MLSVKKSRSRPWAVSQLIERQTIALEIIADRLQAIDAKLDRVAKIMEREINPAAHPF